MYETQVVFGKQDIWGRGVSIEPEADLYRVETALPHPLTANRKSPFFDKICRSSHLRQIARWVIPARDDTDKRHRAESNINMQ